MAGGVGGVVGGNTNQEAVMTPAREGLAIGKSVPWAPLRLGAYCWLPHARLLVPGAAVAAVGGVAVALLAHGGELLLHAAEAVLEALGGGAGRAHGGVQPTPRSAPACCPRGRVGRGEPRYG